MAIESWDRGILTPMDMRTWRGRAIYYGFMIFLLLVALTTLFPFVFSVAASFKEPVEFIRSGLNIFPRSLFLENFTTVFERMNLPKYFWNTTLIAVGELVMRLGVSTLAAYSLSRLKPLGGRLVFLAFLSTLMVPGIAYLIPQYVNVANFGLLQSYWAIWLPAGVNAFTILILKNFFDGIPTEVLDAAKIDGASELRLLRAIILPLSSPIYVVLIITGFIGSWSNFLWPRLVLLGTRGMGPIATEIQGLAQNFNITVRLAAYTVALLPPLIIAIFTQRYLRRGISLGIR